MEIMKLLPAGKDYLWGGTRLRDEYDKKIDIEPLAETWECSTHPDGQSVVENGVFAGSTLVEVIKLHPDYLGFKCNGNSLPILVKFIDAKQDLSVQVHPDDTYARLYENDNGKTEMWYVMDASEDANLIYGFEHPVTPEILKCAIVSGNLDKHLHKVKIEKGDVYFVPPGTVHAIGVGSLIAEIQENSNVTYRVYDYERVGKDGKKREIHFDKAVQVMDMGVASNTDQRPRLVHYYPGCSREILCRCKYFEVEKIGLSVEFSFSVLESSFQVLLCLEGTGSIHTDHNSSIKFQKGDCLFFPAGIGRCYAAGVAEMLKIRC